MNVAGALPSPTYNVADIGMGCPDCVGSGRPRQWKTRPGKPGKRYVAGEGRCGRCDGRGHIPVPSGDVILATALRCAFGGAGGHPNGVCDPETGQLRPGCHEGEYGDDGLIVHWHDTKVVITATANSARPGATDDHPRAQRVDDYTVLLARTFTWAQLIVCVDSGEQMSFGLAAPAGELAAP